jgi:alpha-glucosidase
VSALSVSRWWEGGALYHVYVRSFSDTDGDGFGDLPGVTAKLDHLAWLGVDGIWLSPTTASPNADWGYDVADYVGVAADLGTMEDLDELIARAGDRGIRVLLDLVPNHTSDAHPWFVESRSSATSAKRDWYVWAAPAADGGPPNNWLNATGQPAWSLDESTGQYYLHNFLVGQPDLNWWNDEVHREFERILRFWFDRGVAGFRIDVAQSLYKDRELTDDPPAPFSMESPFGLARTNSMNRPEVHGVYRQWRAVAETYDPPRLLLGETWVHGAERLAPFYGDNDELQLGFNFEFIHASLDAATMKRIVSSTLAALPPGACPVWTGSNHDVARFPGRWAGGDTRRARLALAILASLPGTLVLYYGDELLLADVEVAPELERDEMVWEVGDHRWNRDPCRTPMPWNEGSNYGFCPDGATPWLPLGERRGQSVETQIDDEDSNLWLTRRLLDLRRGAGGDYEELPSGDQQWVFANGRLLTAANFSDRSAPVDLPGERAEGLSTGGGAVTWAGGPLGLKPWEAVVLRR